MSLGINMILWSGFICWRSTSLCFFVTLHYITFELFRVAKVTITSRTTINGPCVSWPWHHNLKILKWSVFYWTLASFFKARQTASLIRRYFVSRNTSFLFVFSCRMFAHCLSITVLFGLLFQVWYRVAITGAREIYWNVTDYIRTCNLLSVSGAVVHILDLGSSKSRINTHPYYHMRKTVSISCTEITMTIWMFSVSLSLRV